MPDPSSKKDAKVRIPVTPMLLRQINAKAAAVGISRSRYIRMLMERDVAAK